MQEFVRSLLVVLGEEIEAARRTKKLSRRKLARQAHLSEDQLERIEAGSVNMRFKQLVRLAAALDCHLVISFRPNRKI